MKWLWLVGVAGAILACLLPAEPQATPASPSAVVSGIQISLNRINHGGAMRFRGTKPAPADEKTFLDIFKNGEAYKLGNDSVDANLIAVLANALREPVNPEPKREDLGFTSAWLKANASPLGEHFTTAIYYAGSDHHIHQPAFESAFADPAFVDKVLPLLFRPHYCADCDHFTQYAEISVRFDDGTQIVARSASDSPFMLPWHLRSNGVETIAYNADISRAIVALLPADSANYSLLSGQHLDKQLGQVVLQQSEHEARLQDVEDKTGGTLAAIRAKYMVETALIGDYGDPAAIGKAGSSPDLLLRLTATNRPANFNDAVALAYVDGKVVGTEKFLAEVPYFEKLALSVPWLTEYAKNHPKTPIDLAFVHDASFSDAGLEIFRADMQAIGRDIVIPGVVAQKDKISFVVIGSGIGKSQWLVFPDRHMLLWKLLRVPATGSAGSDLPAWSSSDYSLKPCAQAINQLVQCVGREVSPTGSLLPE